MTSSWARFATWAVSLIVGAVYGVAGTIAHSYEIGWFPLGLILAAIGCAALLMAVRLLAADRWAALAAGLGMMGTTLMFSGEGPGGSVVVPQNTIAMVWTLLVPLLVVVTVAWPERMRVRPDN
ncbi:DUF6113 family protein [Microbacterium thalassium]|uniref:Histidinol dehydrogenase n=1 Tax=Microbacterium thalassium TaxID=362649 RepID=A0A7X0FSQ3_9MICO|nr:DUF6113 family protein [Microbacterium thalassium]MBB6392321.1 hypothetical protein [Microbacterium thalassium]GLK23531.1 hypothetical protein GCM10017607_08490 [Microbacterium thalassium]